MFGKKVTSEKKSPEENLDIETIPKDFYGGKNPNIYESEEKKNTQTLPKQSTEPIPQKNMSAPPIGSLSPSNELQAVSKQPMQPKQLQKQYAAKKSRKGKKIALIFFVLILLIAAATWYVLSDLLNTDTPKQKITPPPLSGSNASSTTNQNDPQENISTTTTQTPPVVVEPIVPPQQIIIDFPKTTFPDANDFDADGLSDEEELVFGTDASIADSDEDGYVDGLELANLYNPKGIAPRRLIDSGLAREYIHPSNQYRLYHPTVVNVAPVDPLAEQVLINFISGDYISVYVVPLRSPDQSFRSWFSQFATGQQFSALGEQENRFNIPYLMRSDGLVAYFSTDEAVFVLLYQPGIPEDLRYKGIFNMVVQSFRPNRSIPQDIPEQTIVPGTQQSTTTISSTTESSLTEQ